MTENKTSNLSGFKIKLDWARFRQPKFVRVKLFLNYSAWRTENTIGNGIGDGYLCMNMATKFYPGLSLLLGFIKTRNFAFLRA